MTTAARTPKRLYPSNDIRAYERWVRRQKGYGLWEPFVDAQPARDHLFHLMATTRAGWRQLADEAGVPQSTVTYLLYGSNGRRATRITPQNAKRLLALQPTEHQGASMAAIGTQRRIHVLIGEGWPQIHLGPQFDINPRWVSAILKADRVATSTATAVADAYERLEGVDPLTCGATIHGVNLAKRMAVANNWPDRAFWDDYQGRIDDPDFDPAITERPLKRDELAALRRAEIIHLTRYGYTPETIHQRLNGEISLSAIRNIVVEYHKGERRDRRKKTEAAA